MLAHLPSLPSTCVAGAVLPEYVKHKIGKRVFKQPGPMKEMADTVVAYLEKHLELIEVFDELDPRVSAKQNFDDNFVDANSPFAFVSGCTDRRAQSVFYLDQEHQSLLRTHTAAHLPDLIRDGHTKFVIIGEVFRRDEISPFHDACFNQMEIVSVGYSSEKEAMAHMEFVMKGLMKHLFPLHDKSWILLDPPLPFTHETKEIMLKYNNKWVELLGCGTLSPKHLCRWSGSEKHGWGWASGLGLDRLTAIANQVEDVRLIQGPTIQTLSQEGYIYGLDVQSSSLEQKMAFLDAVRSSQANLERHVVEKVEFTEDGDGLPATCCVTLSLPGQTEYSIDSATKDIRDIAKTVGKGNFTRPVLVLRDVKLLSKEKIFGLADAQLAISAIVIKNFVDENACQIMRQLQSEKEFWVSYEHVMIDPDTNQKQYLEYGVFRPKMAYPFNKTYLEPAESEEWSRYFQSAGQLSHYLRSILSPYAYPADRFLRVLDEHLNVNIHTHPKWGKKMNSGMLRLMPQDNMTGLHVDRPPGQELGSFSTILSTNFYFQSSKDGGELVIWDVPPLKFGENPLGSYEKALHLTPESGDVVMFCPRKPHAVRRVKEPRLSLNLFMGLDTESETIKLWN